MKKMIIALLCFILVISLSGCRQEKSSDSQIKTINKNGVNYVIDTEQCTIRDNQQTYSYVIDKAETTIKYSDGQSYTWKESEDMGMGIASPDFDYSTHVDPDILIDVIDEVYHVNNKQNSKNAVLGVILLIAGIIDAIWAERIWFFHWGWRYKNAEPSDLAIGVYRIGGIIAAMIGLINIVA